MKFIFCFDAYCSWCYSFQPIVNQLREKYKNDFEFFLFSGGLLLPQQAVHISGIAEILKQTADEVTKHTGVEFGEDYLWHIQNPDQSDWFPNSEKPAIAISIVKEWKPEIVFDFAEDVQIGLFKEGRDLTDDEAYRHFLYKYNLPVEEFYTALHSEYFKEKAHSDFKIAQHLQASNLPSVLIQNVLERYYLVASGYLEFDIIDERIMSIIAEANN